MEATVYIETFGCQMNVADSERAAHKVFTRIGEVRRQRLGNEPVVGVMGCVAQLEGDTIFANSPSVNIVAGTRATDRLPVLVDRALKGDPRVIDLDERGPQDRWEVSAQSRSSKYVAFVPIIEGCNKFCTYCIVPFSRGREN